MKSSKDHENNGSLRDFHILWGTQSLPQLGSAMTSFALTLGAAGVALCLVTGQRLKEYRYTDEE